MEFFKLIQTFLMIASRYGHIDIINLLIDQKGIDINSKDV